MYCTSIFRLNVIYCVVTTSCAALFADNGHSGIQLVMIKAYNERMTPSEFIVLFILVAAIFYWIDTIFAKEIAVKHGKDRCKELGVTFLDETVEIVRTRLKRNPRGTVLFRREYTFEFSSDGIRRFEGKIVMLGKILSELTMSAYPEAFVADTSTSTTFSTPRFKPNTSSHATYDSTVVDITNAKTKSSSKTDPENKNPTGFR